MKRIQIIFPLVTLTIAALACGQDTSDPRTEVPDEPVAQCVPDCQVAADCVGRSGPSYDLENFECTNGACIYAGCTNDAECAEAEPGTVCAPPGRSSDVGECVKACSAPSDCVENQLRSLGDADNFACESGRCVPLGCNTTQECQDGVSVGSVCVRDGDIGRCEKSCFDDADCDRSNGAEVSDLDNFVCVANACIYTGCNSDAECAEFEADRVCTVPVG